MYSEIMLKLPVFFNFSDAYQLSLVSKCSARLFCCNFYFPDKIFCFQRSQFIPRDPAKSLGPTSKAGLIII